MRYHRRRHAKSRPDGLDHPHPSLHTAASYQARLKANGAARLTGLLRLARLVRREQKAGGFS